MSYEEEDTCFMFHVSCMVGLSYAFISSMVLHISFSVCHSCIGGPLGT
jgi:hypothetical protein